MRKVLLLVKDREYLVGFTTDLKVFMDLHYKDATHVRFGTYGDMVQFYDAGHNDIIRLYAPYIRDNESCFCKAI